jgi:glycosyltransferase involved in cell wall biosynthesis
LVGLTANPSEETLKSLRMQRASHVTRKALGVRYMRRLPISCFIIAKDEADRIGRTIESVQPWVNEVIVVDSGSTDDTMAVAIRAGARAISNAWPGFGQQKRFAEDQCTNDWLLNIDADEVVTPELCREIEALFANGSPPCVAYGMPVQLVYPGASKPRRWARDHWCIRLYDRRAVRFRASAVHDSVVTGSHRYGRLQGALHHFSMRSFGDMKRKLNERTWLSVEHAELLSSAGLIPRLLTEMPMNFLKYYITRRHFTGGLMGLRYASIHSWYRFLKIYRVWHERTFGAGVLNAGQVPTTRSESTDAPDNELPRNNAESNQT